MKKKIVLTTFFTSLALFGVLLANALFNNSINASNAYGEPGVVDHELRLEKGTLATLTDKDGNGLNESPSLTPQEFDLPNYQDTTIKTVRCTKKVDGGKVTAFIRLNAAVDTSNPSYFLKEQPCNRVESITIKVDDGSVDVLIGYETEDGTPNGTPIYTHRYTCTKSNEKKEDNKTNKYTNLFTIPTNGNYFRVENTSTSNSALVQYLYINYDCNQKTNSPSYNVSSGTSEAHTNRGKWYYNARNGSEVLSSSFSNNSLICSVGTVAGSDSSSAVQFLYEDILDPSFAENFVMKITIKVDGGAARIKRGNAYDFTDGQSKTFTTASRPISDSADTLIFALISGNNITITADVVITRIVTNPLNN